VAKDVGRRTVLKSGIGLGVGLSLTPILPLTQDEAASLRPREGDLLVKDRERKPLTPDDIPAGSVQTMAWAMDPADRTVRSGSRLNRVLLLRLDAGQLSVETRSRAAGGVVAYTAVCTHTGCEVVEWLAAERLLQCPCHFSQFDPRDGARVVDGPAPRPLPALPLALVDGQLVVAKPFTARVGFDPA
jgi:rieske iron-sulfur protein